MNDEIMPPNLEPVITDCNGGVHSLGFFHNYHSEEVETITTLSLVDELQKLRESEDGFYVKGKSDKECLPQLFTVMYRHCPGCGTRNNIFDGVKHGWL